MYTVLVEGNTYRIARQGDVFLVNDQPVSCDFSEVRDGYFHIVMNGRGFRAEIVEVESSSKKLIVKVNGRKYPVALKDRFDELLEKMGMNANSGARVHQVRAPMPGLIIAMKVKDGDVVKAGDPLLILEAMKMENIIKAPGDATVKSVLVNLGQGVEKNQVLIEFNPL